MPHLSNKLLGALCSRRTMIPMRFPRLHSLFLFSVILASITSFHAAPKDEWLHIRSKNFNLIGNASEKEIRKVAKKLEQFREAFRLLFSKTKLSASIPTNVVVFKSANAYKPFKPRRADGKADTGIAGYFQAGEDVNYITLSTEGDDADTFGTIFHEYVHFIINTNFGKSDVPPWFNEGLAEYYQTFAMDGDIEAKLGLAQFNHISLLKENRLIPLETFFKISNTQLHQNGNHSRSIFYAQAWAFVHYFVANQKTEGMAKFLALSLDGVPEEKAFQDAFNMTYQQMEKEIRKYIGRSTYQYMIYTFRNKIAPDNEMQTTQLSEAGANAYLGDLLYHTHRYDDAEPYLNAALSLEPDSSMANTTFGMVRLRQRKFDESRAYLEKAISGDPRNHMAYYQYAYLLSREGRDEFGFVASFPPETAAKMREMLKKAVEIDPSYTESYELLAFISLVTNDGLDEAVAALRKALSYQPGNQRYVLRIAEIFMRQTKFDDASALAAKIAKTADDPDITNRANQLIENIRIQQDVVARNEATRKQYEAAMAEAARNGGSRRIIVPTSSAAGAPSPEEIARAERDFEIRSINRGIRKFLPGETRVIGSLQKIECRGGAVFYTARADGEVFILTSKDFQSIAIGAFIMDWNEGVQVGCNANLSAYKAVISFKPLPPGKGKPRGEMVAIEFVPEYFQFAEAKEEQPAETAPVEEIVSAEEAAKQPSEEELRSRVRKEMLSRIETLLIKPADGELRELGFIEKSECGPKGSFFHFKTGDRIVKLAVSSGSQPRFRSFTDVDQLQIGCGMKAVEIPVVFIYKNAPNKKLKSDGELVSMDFVPVGFTLEN